MKLSVISPEAHDSREISILHALFAAGLERYHLRKPNWSARELEIWLGNFSPSERSCIVVHSHPELVNPWGLAGAHERDGGRHDVPLQTLTSVGWRSRACHDLVTLRSALGHFDAVLLSPIFASISKPGHGPSKELSGEKIERILESRTSEQRRTQVFALGGIGETTTEECFRLGFDGVAVLGAVWSADDPTQAFKNLFELCKRLGSPAGRTVSNVVSQTLQAARSSGFAGHPIMCLTQDGLPLSHREQASRLCAAGAQWIQLRMKDANREVWLETADSIAALCRAYGAVFIVNDSVDIALESGADGVHLGKLDLEWTKAREKLGPGRILGGTINNSVDAARAREVGCLDYVGVGPWRFTANKKALAPLLGETGVRDLIADLNGLPAWVIGGIESTDLPAVRATGAAGVAVSSALYRHNEVEENFQSMRAAWPIYSDLTELSSSFIANSGNESSGGDGVLPSSRTRALRSPPFRRLPPDPPVPRIPTLL